MKIVAWNANMALGRKFASLAALHPDIAAVSECECEPLLPAGASFEWVGLDADRVRDRPQLRPAMLRRGRDHGAAMAPTRTQVTSSLGKCPERRLSDCGDPDWDRLRSDPRSGRRKYRIVREEC